MAEKEFCFEKALAELEGIVSSLEEGNIGLDQSLRAFERGVELVRLCNARLSEVEQRVLTVTRDENGAAATADFTGEEEK